MAVRFGLHREKRVAARPPRPTRLPQHSVLAITFVGLSTLLAQPAPAIPDLGRSQSAAQTLERELGESLVIERSKRDGSVRLLRTRSGSAIPTREAASAPASQRARAFLARHATLLGIERVEDFEVVGTSPVDEMGIEHVRLQQRHRGLRIRGAMLNAHLRGGGLVAINGRSVPDLAGLNVVPSVARDGAVTLAGELLAAAYPGRQVSIAEPRLEIFAPSLHGVAGSPSLAWYVEARGDALRAKIFIDARDGAVLLHYDALPDALDRRVHDAQDSSVTPGLLVRGEGDPPTGDVTVDEVYGHMGDTYAYFFGEHGRDSYDGNGSPMVASVHYCSTSSSCVIQCPCSNAFWFGDYAVFGSLLGDDIVAHEFTHGVTDHTAALIYYAQSGALNESYSDIFGELVDLWNGTGNDTAEVRWLIGEEILPATGIRDMWDPLAGGLGPDPGRVGDAALHCDPDDGYGVHTNSGIGNHAFALMADGGTYNGATIAGIGLTKAARIAYRTLTMYLFPSATYRDSYLATQQACGDLIGQYGIDAIDCTQVVLALDAVEMGERWPCDCGNGVIDWGEECDDGNVANDDGCNRRCQVESSVPLLGGHPSLLVGLALGMILVALLWTHRESLTTATLR